MPACVRANARCRFEVQFSFTDYEDCADRMSDALPCTDSFSRSSIACSSLSLGTLGLIVDLTIIFVDICIPILAVNIHRYRGRNEQKGSRS